MPPHSSMNQMRKQHDTTWHSLFTFIFIINLKLKNHSKEKKTLLNFDNRFHKFCARTHTHTHWTGYQFSHLNRDHIDDIKLYQWPLNYLLIEQFQIFAQIIWKKNLFRHYKQTNARQITNEQTNEMTEMKNEKRKKLY